LVLQKLLLRDGAQDAGGSAEDDHAPRDVFDDDASGGDERVFSYRNAGEEGCVRADARASFEDGAAEVLFALLGAAEVVVVGEGDAGSDEAVVADRGEGCDVGLGLDLALAAYGCFVFDGDAASDDGELADLYVLPDGGEVADEDAVVQNGPTVDDAVGPDGDAAPQDERREFARLSGCGGEGGLRGLLAEDRAVEDEAPLADGRAGSDNDVVSDCRARADFDIAFDDAVVTEGDVLADAGVGGYDAVAAESRGRVHVRSVVRGAVRGAGVWHGRLPFVCASVSGETSAWGDAVFF
jgi:hypothetical protein